MDESSMKFEERLPKEETHRMSGIRWETVGEAGVC